MVSGTTAASMTMPISLSKTSSLLMLVTVGFIALGTAVVMIVAVDVAASVCRLISVTIILLQFAMAAMAANRI